MVVKYQTLGNTSEEEEASPNVSRVDETCGVEAIGLKQSGLQGWFQWSLSWNRDCL